MDKSEVDGNKCAICRFDRHQGRAPQGGSPFLGMPGCTGQSFLFQDARPGVIGENLNRCEAGPGIARRPGRSALMEAAIEEATNVSASRALTFGKRNAGIR